MGRIAAACADKPRIKIKMSPQDTVELLANLNFVVERIREDSGWPHKTEVLLKLLPRLRKRHTNRQIDNKLRLLIGSADPKTIDDVYRYGSSRMKSLDDDLKAMILEELKTIKSEEVCIVVSTPRQLRSVSRNPTTEPSRSLRGTTVFDERTPTRSSSRNRAIERRRFKREETYLGERTPTKTVRKAQRGERHSCASKVVKKEPLLSKQTLLNRDTSNVLRQNFPPRLATTPPCTSVADTEEKIESSQSSDTCMEGSPNGAPSLRSASQSVFYTTELQDTITVDYVDPNTENQFPEKPILNRSHETLRDLFSDNLYFRKKWSESEERRQKMDRNERLRNSLLASGSADIVQTMANTIESQNEKINNLQRQLNNQTFLQQFLTLGRGEEVPLNLAQIRTYHAKMRRDFRSLSIMDYFKHPEGSSACLESRDLKELKSKVLNDVNHYPVGLVIESLTGAAVCEWVFNGTIQCTAMMNTPLLDGYRHHLHTICGELGLRNVDLAAHQWVINEELHFQEKFIPRTATKLSERLLTALSPFMKNKKKPEAKLENRLKSIFCAALNIKSFGMIGKNVFEFIWPAHGSTIEGNYMVEEIPEGVTSHQTPPKQDVKKVMLALVPGLRIYNYDRKLVDYSGFTKGDEEGLEHPSLVAQAVVVAQ